MALVSAVKKSTREGSLSLYSLMPLSLVAVLFFCEVVASHCGENQFMVDHADGNMSCEDCESCPPGQGLSHRCGTHIPSNAMVVCVPCQPGDTFSSGDDTSHCTPCSSCAEDQVVHKKCTSANDVKCEKRCHSKNRYFDSSSGSCLPCSTCCGDGEDKFEDECKRKFGATSDSVCSFNKSINRCDATTTATSSTTVTNEKNSRNATSSPSLTGIATTFASDVRSHGSSGAHPSEGTGGSIADYVAWIVVLIIASIVAFVALRVYIWYARRKHSNLSRGNSDAEKGSHHSGGDNEEEEHELVAMHGKEEMVADEGVVSARICVEVNEEEQDQKESNDPLLGKKVFFSGRRKHSNLSRDNSDAEKGSHHSGGDNEEEEHELVAMGKKEMEEGVVSASICVEVNEEEQDEKGSNDPLLGKDRARFTCACQKRAKKDSKPLVRLLEDVSLLQDICVVLDAPAPGCGNWERLAQSYGYNYYQITSVLKKFDGGPSRGLIEGVVAAYPDLTVEEFATSVEKKTNRKDVAKKLRHFDLK